MQYTHNVPALKLAAMFKREAIGASDCAHLCIDVQEKYVLPNEWCADSYEDIANHIGQSIAPAFRKAGIPNIWICFSTQLDANRLPAGDYSFCKVRPLDSEPVIPKRRANSFTSNKLLNLLEGRNTRLIVMSGFSFHCCVNRTDAGAPQSYNRIILLDGTDYDERQADIIARRGTILTTSENFFAALEMSQDTANDNSRPRACSAAPRNSSPAAAPYG